MKTLRLLVVSMLFLGIGMLTACSHFKSGAKKTTGGTATQTAGLGAEEDGFASEGSPNRLKAPYNQTYHFDLNKYDVKQDDTDSINAQAEYLLAHSSAKIRLEGNCDDRGSREYNIALGWKRAKAVAAVLKQQGVSNAQIATVSYGKEKLVAFGHDEEAHRLNRRVDLIYEAK
jgi:peptidoglycan-associated lipoprotein